MADASMTVKGRATQQRIVDSARRLVRQNGVAGTSLADVEKDAVVGRSQMYHYFSDRDELLRTVVRKNGDALVDRAQTLLTDVEELRDLSRWLDAVAESNVAAGTNGCPIGSLINQLDLRDTRNRAALIDAFDRWRAPLAAALRRLQSVGRVDEHVLVDDLADQIMCLIQGGLQMAQLREDPRQLRLALDAANRYLANVSKS